MKAKIQEDLFKDFQKLERMALDEVSAYFRHVSSIIQNDFSEYTDDIFSREELEMWRTRCKRLHKNLPDFLHKNFIHNCKLVNQLLIDERKRRGIDD